MTSTSPLQAGASELNREDIKKVVNLKRIKKVIVMRIRFVMTVLMLLGLGGALKVNAQNWAGNAPS
ncbi:MAG: hypothetical protein ACI3YX_07265, partial [Prevotella sp.]